MKPQTVGSCGVIPTCLIEPSGWLAGSQFAAQVEDKLFRACVLAETSGGGHTLKLFMPLTMRLAECKPVADLIPDVSSRPWGGRGHAGRRRLAAVWPASAASEEDP